MLERKPNFEIPNTKMVPIQFHENCAYGKRTSSFWVYFCGIQTAKYEQLYFIRMFGLLLKSFTNIKPPWIEKNVSRQQFYGC